jgi:hypothetical protein
VTPSSSTVTESPAPIDWPELIVHDSTVDEATPQLPTALFVVLSVTVVLTIVPVLELGGSVIAICWPAAKAPVAEVLK